MRVFHTDLDNTLIYSYKHDIGSRKSCVEIYQKREISFMTERSMELLKEVCSKMLVVPTTTRTVEQYNRIDLRTGVPEYALACNGGVLLQRGEEDTEWYRESVRLVSDAAKELQKAELFLEADENRSLEVRNIRGLFLFTKSEKPKESIERLEQVLDLSLVEVFRNGVKVYVVPKRLDKGSAVRRFREKLGAELVLAAGDSEFDVPMLLEADIALAPKALTDRYALTGSIRSMDERERLFSEQILEYILSL